jgi:hypothetical protein
MIENVIKSRLLPDTIHFNHTIESQTEVMRITRDGVWVNPDIPVDETIKAVLNSLDSQIKVLVQRAVEDEREECIEIVDMCGGSVEIVARIRERGQQ